MRKNLLLLSFILSCYFVFGQYVPSPQIGDFQSKANGNWETPNSWNVYDGNSWVPAITYPGQGSTALNQSLHQYNVFIRPGDEISFTNSATYYFGSIYILSCYKSPTTQECLRLPTRADFDLNDGNVSYGKVNIGAFTIKLYGNNQNINIFGGILKFPSQGGHLWLLQGNSLVITNYNGSVGNSSVLGSNCIQPVTNQDCTGQRSIFFVNLKQDGSEDVQQEYAVCAAQRGVYTFKELNARGGSLFSMMSLSKDTICKDQTVTLNGTYSGLMPAGTVVQYKWSFVNGPNNPTNFNTDYANFSPHVVGGTNPTSSHTITFTEEGTYTFRLETRYDYEGQGFFITSVVEMSVTVNPLSSPGCACYMDPVMGNTTNSSSFGISSLQIGNSTQSTTDWLSERQGGALVLESKTQGLVINRTPDVTLIQNPVEGMIVYDTTNKKLMVYKPSPAGGGAMEWKSAQDPACPTSD